MYQDDHGKWFCPDCVLEEIEPDFLDEKQIGRGDLKRPYVLETPDQAGQPKNARGGFGACQEACAPQRDTEVSNLY